MLFNSFEFLLFFPLVTILFFLLPHKFRWAHLLFASCVFYMYFIPIYIVILFGTIIIDYIAGILIENAEGRKRKLFLTMSIVANVGVLVVFKYYNFFIGNFNFLMLESHSNFSIPLMSILLPIGLSFHTFQAMSYTIEVYRGAQKAERHFGIYSLYVMFYPQLVAGPIERPQNLLHQFHEKHEFSYENATSGLRQMGWGLFKKVVIGDRLAILIDPLFNHPEGNSGLALFIASIFFSIQIYCDFSGYSDIAIGCARVMGFNLMENFNHPYNATSITTFWRKWHISLSTWFKDYLYIPLGGSKVAEYRRYINLFFVFLVSGFWHGANWTYIIWGALHGIFSVFGLMTHKLRSKFNQAIGLSRIRWLDRFVQQLITFLLVTLAWVFFRAHTVHDAFYILGKISHMGSEAVRALHNRKIITRELLYGVDIRALIMGFLSIIVLESIHFLEGDSRIYEMIGRKPKVLRWSLYLICFVLISIFGVFGSRQFIYFQF